MRLQAIIAFALLLPACTPVVTNTPPVAIAAEESEAVRHANFLADEPGAFRDGYWGSGNTRIHYVEAGEGPTIVFVHGFPSFWYAWRDQMEWLRQCRRVIAIDAPGAGLSGKPADTSAYKVENLARQLDRFIADIAPGEQIVLVGHDWGGALAWSYAEWNASRLDRVAVFSAPPYDLILQMLTDDPQQREGSLYMLRLAGMDAEDASGEFPYELYSLAYRRMLEDDILSDAEGELFRQALAIPGATYGGVQWYRANIAPFEGIDPERMAWPSANAVADVPVLLVRGSEDRIFVESMADRAASHAASLDVEMLDGVGHNTPFEDPDAAAMALADFLDLPAFCGTKPVQTHRTGGLDE